MQQVSQQLAQLLAMQVRTPQVEIVVQYPSPNNTLQLGSALVLDGITDITITRNEEPSSDSLDFALANGDGRYSPLSFTA